MLITGVIFVGALRSSGYILSQLVLSLLGQYSVPSFFCPLWFVGERSGYVLSDRKFSLDPEKCAHSGFQVKYVSRYWMLILGNVDELEGEPVGVYRRVESSMFHRDLFSSLVMVAECEERP